MLSLPSSQVMGGIHCPYCPPKSQMEMEYIVSTVTSGIRCLMALVTAEWLAHWTLARNKAHFISSMNESVIPQVHSPHFRLGPAM